MKNQEKHYQELGEESISPSCEDIKEILLKLPNASFEKPISLGNSRTSVVVVAYPLYRSDTSQNNSIRLLTVKKSMTRCGRDVQSSLESQTQFRMYCRETG
ncbi:hypothetical protein TNCV_62841 [Trichonephila clavipes]|nr:hypothetical protein TNCV_62841 [Trichonephila clavipes]